MSSDELEPSETCVACGAVIGMYEPMVVVRGDREVFETSFARGDEIDPEDARYHRDCYRG